jgi:CDP-diacylglycerol---glycerol-3-phosphate 3-phosphatidyltransferase
MTLADKITLSRLLLAPLIIAAYLLLPMEHFLCFWFSGWLCALAEYSDYVDGRVARIRGEVSDFGKLADPFCDVLYRITVFLALLLPAGGIGYAVGAQPDVVREAGYDIVPFHQVGQLVFVTGIDGGTTMGAGLVPWLPVLLMAVREIVAGALRAMAATKGLVLAARSSGKIKAWLQGFTIITLLAFPACFWHRSAWHLEYAFWATWICAVVSVASIIEYVWVNRLMLARLLDRKSNDTAP